MSRTVNLAGLRPPCRAAVLALLSFLLVATAGASSATVGQTVKPGKNLPMCVRTHEISVSEPTGLPGAPGVPVCQALPTRVTKGPPDRLPLTAHKAQDPIPHAGYHYLGAQSSEQLSLVRPRLQVKNPSVRRNTFDFVVARVMAKEDYNGSTRWLEAGWAEVGWRNDDQYVYTWDTRDKAWKFYDQYNLGNGTRFYVVIDSEVSSSRSTYWRAWVWWNNAWNLLSRISLPVYDEAFIEEYVEVYRDPNQASHFFLPEIDVDNVQIKTSPTAAVTSWRDPPVSTLPGSSISPYCLTWFVRFDSFRAASC